ncbi:DUF1501 domain-containing protein, partial [Rhodopirellula bahusiensis]
MNSFPSIQRRSFLKRGTYSVGMAALGSMLARESQASQTHSPQPHFPGTAKTVIHLCMAGGPSHMESLDPKPELDKINDQPFPASMTDGQQLAQLQGSKLIARGSFCKFKKWGQSGLEISELFPNIGSVADDLCIIRSMHTEQINH